MRIFHEKQGPLHRIVFEMDASAGFFWNLPIREELLIPEARKLCKVLQDAIAKGEKAAAPVHSWVGKRST